MSVEQLPPLRDTDARDWNVRCCCCCYSFRRRYRCGHSTVPTAASLNVRQSLSTLRYLTVSKRTEGGSGADRERQKRLSAKEAQGKVIVLLAGLCTAECVGHGGFVSHPQQQDLYFIISIIATCLTRSFLNLSSVLFPVHHRGCCCCPYKIT